MQEASAEMVAPGAAVPRKLFAQLQLPALSLSSLSFDCVNERQLFNWLAHYDLHPYQPADQQRLATMLLSMMDEICRWQAPAARRLPMLDLLREYTIACVDAMAVQRATLAGIQTSELRTTVLASMRLLQGLGTAYASIAEQLFEGDRVPLLARSRCARSLQRAVDSFRRIPQITALFSLATPQRCWRNMQLLVQLALATQLSGKKVRDMQHRQGVDRVADAYCQVALFASANPTQHSSEEQERLWQLTHDWASAAQIVTAYTDQQNSLLASLALDQPPVPANRLGTCKVDLRHFTAPAGWKIDLTGVQRQLARTQSKHCDPLLERLQDAWQDSVGRVERRSPLQQHCDLVFGIGAIAHHLGDSVDASAAAERFFNWSGSSRGVLCLETAAADAAADSFGGMLPNAPHLGSSARMRSRSVAQVGERYRPERVDVINCSSRGVGLRLPSAIGERARMGELVGVRLQEAWQVAVIRWQHILPDHCRAGVEVIAAECLPVKVQRHTAAGHLSAPIAGLLVKVTPEDKPELILPVPLFKCYDSVELLTPSEPRQVTLQRQTLTTSSFARFEFV